MNVILLYAGIALMGAATLYGAVSLVVFFVTGKRLKAKLNEEFGEKRG